VHSGWYFVLDHRHVILAVGDSTRPAMSLFIWLPENTSHNVVTWRLFSVLLYNLTILFEQEYFAVICLRNASPMAVSYSHIGVLRPNTSISFPIKTHGLRL